MKKKTEDATTTTSVASKPEVIGDPEKREETKEKKVIIKESEHYNISMDGQNRVFTINNDYDFQVFRKGMLSKNPRVWRGNETCNNFMNDWNTNKSSTYSVEYADAKYFPSRMGF